MRELFFHIGSDVRIFSYHEDGNITKAKSGAKVLCVSRKQLLEIAKMSRPFGGDCLVIAFATIRSMLSLYKKK